MATAVCAVSQQSLPFPSDAWTALGSGADGNDHGLVGLARVSRRASDHPRSFRGWTALHCEGVDELYVGRYVLVLQREPGDFGWTPVIANDKPGGRRARFAWVHPQSICFVVEEELGGKVVVGHTSSRNNDPPAPDLGTFGLYKGSCGVISVGEHVVLDARWKGHGEQDTDRCSGFCASVCVAIASCPDRTADILEFAGRRCAGVVVCERGRHRSVSAGKILELVCRRTVDYDFAVRPRCYKCCGRRAEENFHVVWQAFRNLPSEPSSKVLLADVLRLPCQ